MLLCPLYVAIPDLVLFAHYVPFYFFCTRFILHMKDQTKSRETKMLDSLFVWYPACLTCTLYSRFVLEPQEVKFLRVVCKRKEEFKIDPTTLVTPTLTLTLNLTLTLTLNLNLSLNLTLTLTLTLALNLIPTLTLTPTLTLGQSQELLTAGARHVDLGQSQRLASRPSP
jgi:hypothetical protein